MDIMRLQALPLEDEADTDFEIDAMGGCTGTCGCSEGCTGCNDTCSATC